jgi:predicted NUDIX family NTP pyrophosphohydrolase
MAAKHSAGILLFRLASDAPEFLLIHPGGPFWTKRDLGAWSIPKGGYEEGEAPQACALRELREELGDAAPELALSQLVELGSIRQKAGKVVDAWAAEADFDPARLDSNTFSMEWPRHSGVEREFPEVDRAEWFDAEQARRKILPAQAAFLDRALDYMGRS